VRHVSSFDEAYSERRSPRRVRARSLGEGSSGLGNFDSCVGQLSLCFGCGASGRLGDSSPLPAVLGIRLYRDEHPFPSASEAHSEGQGLGLASHNHRLRCLRPSCQAAFHADSLQAYEPRRYDSGSAVRHSASRRASGASGLPRGLRLVSRQT